MQTWTKSQEKSKSVREKLEIDTLEISTHDPCQSGLASALQSMVLKIKCLFAVIFSSSLWLL